MGILVWTMIGLAVWHFTIFLPDRFWGGIVGACMGAIVGALILGMLVYGLSVPGRDETDIVTALVAIPGAVLGIAAVYLIGARREPAES
jgi:hypothetical protein